MGSVDNWTNVSRPCAEQCNCVDEIIDIYFLILIYYTLYFSILFWILLPKIKNMLTLLYGKFFGS